jgi:hypothetical protein
MKILAEDLTSVPGFVRLMSAVTEAMNSEGGMKFMELADFQVDESFDPTDSNFNYTYYFFDENEFVYEYGLFLRDGILYAGLLVGALPTSPYVSAFEKMAERLVQTNLAWLLTEERVAGDAEEGEEPIEFLTLRFARPVAEFAGLEDGFDQLSAHYLAAVEALLQLKTTEAAVFGG